MDIPVASKFKHKLKTVGERLLLIEATCLICGAAKAMPFLDGSLEEWEPIHLQAHRINRMLQPNDKRRRIARHQHKHKGRKDSQFLAQNS